MSRELIQLKGSEAREYPGDTWYSGWPITDNTWLVVASNHPGLHETGAKYCLCKPEYDRIIECNKDSTERGSIRPESVYRCYLKGNIYYMIGWWGSCWNKFGLEDAYWMVKSLCPKAEFIRGRELLYEGWRNYMRRGKFEYLRPCIESLRDREWDYYLVEDVEKIMLPCRGCGKPVAHPGTADKPREAYFGHYWDAFAAKHRLQHRQIEKIQERVPRWMRFLELACSPECERILRKRAGRHIYERVQTWARENHEKERIKRLKALQVKVRKSLKTGNLDALKSLQKEYEQEATSLV